MTSSNDASNKIIQTQHRKTILWTVASVCSSFIIVLILSTIKTPDGDYWLESSTIGQTVSTLGVVASAVLPTMLSSRKDTAVIREQVQNSHQEPLRNDLDGKHDTVIEKLNRLEARIDSRFEGVASDIRGIRRDVGRVSDQGLRTQDAIISLADRVDRNRDSVDVVTKALEVRVSNLEEGNDGR